MLNFLEGVQAINTAFDALDNLTLKLSDTRNVGHVTLNFEGEFPTHLLLVEATGPSTNPKADRPANTILVFDSTDQEVAKYVANAQRVLSENLDGFLKLNYRWFSLTENVNRRTFVTNSEGTTSYSNE